MKKYWHKLSKEEQARILKECPEKGITVEEFKKQYKKPDWCNCSEALDGIWGCWGLLFGYIRSEKDCKDCDCYKKGRNNNEEV